jgi:hypothetical protein
MSKALNAARKANMKSMKKKPSRKMASRSPVPIQNESEMDGANEVDDPYKRFGSQFDQSSDDDDYALLHPNSPKVQATSTKELTQPISKLPEPKRQTRSTTKNHSNTKMLRKAGLHLERTRTVQYTQVIILKTSNILSQNLAAKDAAKKHIKQISKKKKKQVAATAKGLLKQAKAKETNESDNTVLHWPKHAVECLKLCSAKKCKAGK